MKNWTGFLLFLILTAAACYGAYRYGKSQAVEARATSDTVYSERLIERTDTITNWKPKIIYIKKDSANSNENFIQRLETLDTILTNAKDSIYLSLKRYETKEVNYSLAYRFAVHDSIERIIEKHYLEAPKKWFDDFHIGIGAGYGFNLSGESTVRPTINLSVYYKIF